MLNTNTDIFKFVDNFEKTAKFKSIEIIKGEQNAECLLSIIIPTYKRAELLKECLDSILGQVVREGYPDFEILVVDNNPQRGDQTEMLLQTYNVPNLRYYKNEENIGMTGNFNRCYSLARGKWVTMIHDDDALYETFLANIESRLNIKGAIIPRFIYGEEFTPVNFLGKPRLKRIDHRSFSRGNINGAPAGLTVWREYFMETGGFNDLYYPSMDYHWSVMFSHRYPMYKLTEPLAFWRISTNESLNPDTMRGFLIKDYYIRRTLLRETFGIPYSIIDYYLATELTQRNNWFTKLHDVDCGFQLSDVGLQHIKFTSMKTYIIKSLIKVGNFIKRI